MKNIKKIVSVSSILFFAFVLLFTFGAKHAEAATCTAVNSTDDWSDPVGWTCGHAPTSGDDVIIDTGRSMWVDSSSFSPDSANTVTVNSGGSLVFYDDAVLNVSGAVILNSPAAAGTTALTVGKGILSVGSLNINGGTSGKIAQATVTGGTLHVVGNTTFSGGAAQAQLSISGAGLIQLEGNLGNSGTFTDSGSGTVLFDGSSTQTMGAYTYNNVSNTNSSSGGVVLSGATIINGFLSLNLGGLDAGTNNLTVNGGVDISGGALQKTGTGTMTLGSVLVHNGGMFSPGLATLLVNGTTVADVNGGIAFSSATGVKTFSGDVTVTNGSYWLEQAPVQINFGGNLTNSSTYSYSFTASSGVHTFTGNPKGIKGVKTITIPTISVTGRIVVSGTLSSSNISGSGELDVNDNLIYDGATLSVATFDASSSQSIVSYTGVNQTVADGHYSNVVISNVGTKIIANTVFINGILEIDTGAHAHLVGTIYTGFLSINNVPQVSGTWGATGFGATHNNDTVFLWTGMLDVQNTHIVPLVTGAVLLNSTTIRLSFNETVEASGVQDANNLQHSWILAGGATTPTITAGSDIYSNPADHQDLTISGYTGGALTLAYPNTIPSAYFDITNNVGDGMLPIVSPIVVTDNLSPTLGITLSNSAMTVGQTSLVTFTFSETVTGFDNADVTVSNGTLSTITVSGTDPRIYTATFTPTAGISAPNNAITVGTGWTDTSVAHNAPAGTNISPNYSINTIVSHGGGGGGGSYIKKVDPVVVPVVPVVPVVSGSSGLVFTQKLSQGMTHGEVVKLQKFLNANGYTVALSGAGSKGYEVDTFGSRTTKALMKFQKDNGMKADGVVGTKTRELLNKLWKDSYNTETKIVPVVPVVKKANVVVTTEGKTFTKPLMQGVTDDEVIALQKLLNENGYPIADSGAGSKGNEINIFGSRTTQALMKFQKDNGMTADGVVGPKVREFLNNFTKGR